MKNAVKAMKLLSDPARLRILMILTKREMCVCQIMGVLGISQPLVSRNLTLLSGAGLLDERKEGKLVFYSLKREIPPIYKSIIAVLRTALKSDSIVTGDLMTLKDCREYQKKTGRCDMKTFSEFMKRKKRREL